MIVHAGLTTVELGELARNEATIERGIRTFVDVGRALLSIRDGRLYRENYKTFEEYCRARWDMSRIHAHRMIAAHSVVDNLLPTGNNLPTSERQTRPLTLLEPEQQIEAWHKAIEIADNSGGKITGKIVQQAAREIRPEVIHVSDDSYEWYTPIHIIESVCEVLGGIDLDPASCEEANKIVGANTYYTKDNDGLLPLWQGRVFLNPPYNMPLVEKFTGMAIREYQNGNIEAAIILVNNATDTQWFHKLLGYPACFTKGRVSFWTTNKPNLGARQGQVLFYLGKNNGKFNQVFSKHGAVMVRL